MTTTSPNHPGPCFGEGCHLCKLARESPRYAHWRGGEPAARPRRQIDPDKPRLPKGVPP